MRACHPWIDRVRLSAAWHLKQPPHQLFKLKRRNQKAIIWLHSAGDNSSNFFSAASYTLTWSIGNSALRSLALFCAASSGANTAFIRPSTCKPKPTVITRSARVMLRGCGSSGIVRGFFMATPFGLPPPHLITALLDGRAKAFREVFLVVQFSTFSTVAVNDGHQTSSMQSLLFPSSGR